MHDAAFVADLAIVLGVAAATSVLARLLRQPTILGYLVAGLIVGPYLPIPLFADSGRVESLAEFGVILVMFAIGLEFRLSRLIKVLPISGFAGLVQISFLLWCGFSLGQVLGWGTVESLFLGTSIAISSTMVVSRLFDQMPVTPDLRQFVLGVLVIQDVAAIILIAAMTAVAASGGVAPDQLVFVLGQLAVVLLMMLGVGLLIIPRAMRAVVRLESKEILVVFSIGICFAMALLAEKFGYSVALGAFLAGVLVAESGQGAEVEHSIHPVRDMFAAIFFVSIGMTVDPGQALENLPVALIVFLVVIGGQFASVSTAGVLSGSGLRTSLQAGLSLGQIGEFAFILAGIGIAAGAVRPTLQPILVTVAVLTAFTTPLFLKLGDRIVHQIDRRLPRRLQHLLSLYEDWLERFHDRSPEERQGRPVQRAIRVLAFDAIALTALLGVAILLAPRISTWLARELQLSDRHAFWIVDAAVVVAGVPLLFGLVRNTLKLSRLVGKSILPDEQEPSGPGRIAFQALRVMVYFGVVLGVGAPMIALLRPFTGRSYGVLLLSAGILAIVVYLWKSAGRVEREFRSGAEQIAQVLARQSREEDTQILSNPELLPGLDNVSGLRVPAGAFAVGRTLSQLELRARTGATVVAIQRSGTEAIVPTGREALAAEDLLAILGSQETVQRARDLILNGPSPSRPEAVRDRG